MPVVGLKTPLRKAHRRILRIGTFCHNRQRQVLVRTRRYPPRGNRVFSAKYTDPETGLILYPYRPYLPALGRWLSRDPLGENGGANLFEFVRNNPAQLVDAFGRESRNPTERLSPADPTVPQKTWDWANQVLDIYGSKALNVTEGMPTGAAWVNAITTGLMQVGWGVLLEHLGSQMSRVAQEQVVCNYYYHVRFNDELPVSESRFVQSAPAERQGDVMSWIEDHGGAQGESSGYGYRAFTWPPGKLLVYMSWKDLPKRDKANVVLAAPRVDLTHDRPIRYGRIFYSCSCCNHGLVPN